MGHSLEDAYVAHLSKGGLLVLHPKRGVHLFTSAERAVRWLERDGWDYYVTHQNSDTGDELEQWIPLHDQRWEEDE